MPTTHTSLAQARGHHRIISNGQRINERQPFPVLAVNANDYGKAKYLLEVATFHTASGCWEKALGSLRDAFVIACRWRWLSVAQKTTTPIVEPEILAYKLRCSTFLDREEYDAIRRLLIGYQPSDIFEIERMELAVAKVIVSP
jgi:hypothetical protein